jgi:hypothetical protein
MNEEMKSQVHVDGRAPLISNLALHVDEQPAFMDALATEFAARAAQLSTQRAYWLALNGWMTDTLSGAMMEGEVGVGSLGKYAWAIYASSYWGGMELRQNWGMPPVIQKLGVTIAAPFADVQQRVADSLAQRIEAVRQGGGACLEYLPILMREDTTSGAIYPIAYNAGVQVVKTEDPPVGQRRAHRVPKPAAVRINARDFMRVDYELPTPRYLKVWRSAFERAVTSNPDAYERAVAGSQGMTNLRDIWKRAVAYGNVTWGGDANDQWSESYFDETVHWSSVLNLGLEAVGLAAFVAVINQDPEAATRAVLGNAIYAGATSGWLIGLLDTGAELPTVVSG